MIAEVSESKIEDSILEKLMEISIEEIILLSKCLLELLSSNKEYSWFRPNFGMETSKYQHRRNQKLVSEI